MAAEPKDFRVALTPDIEAALTAVARAFGRSKQDVAREVLGEWAKRKLHEARVLTGLAHANGAITASDGLPAASDGVVAEDDGTRWRRGR